MAEENKEYMPRLRFPEFHRTESWIQTPLKDVASLKTGYAFKSQNYVSNGKFKIVTISNVKSGYFDKENMNTINELPSDIQEHQILNRGDILISMTGNVGRVCRVDAEQCLLNQRVGKIIPFGINNIFIYHIFQTDIFIDTMKIKAIGGAQGNLSVSSIQEHKVYYPRKEEEQQKIADCLSSIDELIEAHEQKRDALLEHKKGLMQRLFPAEGENTPPWRFPEFLTSGEWKNIRLESVLNVVRGASPRPIDEYITDDDLGSNWLKIGDIDRKSKYIYKTCEKITNDGASKSRSVPAGTLILSNSMSFGRPYILKIPVCIHDGWLALIDINITVEIDFLYYVLLSDKCQKYFLENAAGAVVKNLNVEIIKNLFVDIPSLPEQQKIADCLSSLDARIEAEEVKITSLREHKQGLMQRLFPQSL